MNIGFIGGVNAFTVPYALKFRGDGYDVKYISSAAPDDFLNRPEHQFPNKIQYPYPSWICENVVTESLMTRAFPEFFHKKSILFMQDRDVIFLNDYGLSIARHLPKKAILIAICSGSDLDVMCNYKTAWHNSFKIRRIWMWPLSIIMNVRWVFLQRSGLKKVSCISYFPPGLNKEGDKLISSRAKNNQNIEYIPRYDVDFDSAGIKFVGAIERDLKKILVPVRFCINPIGSNAFEYKGNDKIIEGLAKYAKRNRNVEIRFFSKGPKEDLALAKSLCKAHGIENNVIWVPPLPLNKLIDLYYESDVIIDQIGSHWMGAVGVYGMCAGKAVIANWRPEVFTEIYHEPFPVLQASTSDEVYEHLVECEKFDFRRDIGVASNSFAKRNLDTQLAYRKYKEYIEKVTNLS